MIKAFQKRYPDRTGDGDGGEGSHMSVLDCREVEGEGEKASTESRAEN